MSHLHLPRIICLHGGGTNARIFRLQCRALEKRLQDSFRLVYAQAPFVANRPGPDVTLVYENFGPFRKWFPDDYAMNSVQVAAEIDAALDAAMVADDNSGATGEWAGILGFSQGAKVAASVLYRQQKCGGSIDSSFALRFGVLFAGRGPLVWLAPELPLPDGLVDADAPFAQSPPWWLTATGSDSHVLKETTIHIHGLRDPGLNDHRQLLRDYCDPSQATLVEWEGEHRIPIKSRDVDIVVQQIQRVAFKAAPQVPEATYVVGGWSNAISETNVTFRAIEVGY